MFLSVRILAVCRHIDHNLLGTESQTYDRKVDTVEMINLNDKIYQIITAML